MKMLTTLILTLLLSSSLSAAEEESALKDIAEELSSIRPQIKNGTVAVFPFEAHGFAESTYGTYVSDKISAALAGRKKLTLVEREKLSRVLAEKELSMIGLAEQDEAKQIGALLSVDAIITGRIYRTESGSEITVKAIDTSSGRVLAVISKKYSYTSRISGKRKSAFTGTWRVITTAPYLLEKDMRYEKLILRDDDSFSLHLINNAGRDVEIRGSFRIEKNNINYRPQQMFFDGSRTSFKRLSSELEGTIYLVKGELYFNYTGMDQKGRTRLDAMDKMYRCTAERIE